LATVYVELPRWLFADRASCSPLAFSFLSFFSPSFHY
jgi:hypothetical protein